RLLDVAARRRPHVVDPLPGCTDGGDYGDPEGHQTGRPGPCAITRWPQAPVHRGGLLGPGPDARGEFPVRRYDASWPPTMEHARRQFEAPTERGTLTFSSR